MKLLSILLSVLMVFGLFSNKASASNEAAFWKWFTTNEPRLFFFEKDQESLFNELAREIHRVDRDLTFEFGPVEDGRREFVISADGIKSAFPAVEALYSAAPDLDRWIWVKYRPRRHPILDLELDGLSVKVDEVSYLLARDGEKVGIVLFFENYSVEAKTTFEQIGYLFLDEALGEFAIETQVGFIEIHGRDSKYFDQSHSLKELPAQFDEYLERRGH